MKLQDIKIQIIKSRKRRKTISAHLVKNTLIVRSPYFLPKWQENKIIGKFIETLRNRKDIKSDKSLHKRALYLYEKYLHKSPLSFTICWTKKQQKTYGTCNQIRKHIRISERIKYLPLWVTDYIIIHELAHLIAPNHSKEFWKLVFRYEKSLKAKGFLEGWEFRKQA